MYVNFHELPEQARIWIYQAERALDTKEQALILEAGKNFLEQWVTHGESLVGSLQIVDDYFLVVGVDDRQLPSGCSIDASVAFVRSLGEHLNVDFFGRTNILLNTRGTLSSLPLADLKGKLRAGEIDPQTRVYNTLAAKAGELKTWLQPIQNSWLARFLPETQEN